VASLSLDTLGWTAANKALVLSLSIESGGVAVVHTAGPSAAVLADVILGLAPPERGSIQVGDRDVTALPAGRRGIALVPAGGGLLPHLTVERNVEYAGGDSARWMRRLRLEGIGRFRPHELSPVQRLQVALARALSIEPAAVLLEDRAGQVPCRTAVAEASLHAAVLVITDSAERGATLLAQDGREDPHRKVVRPAEASHAS
jgi:ABC-type sulfate/molybdate transport systems ATPase subunit